MANSKIPVPNSCNSFRVSTALIPTVSPLKTADLYTLQYRKLTSYPSKASKVEIFSATSSQNW